MFPINVLHCNPNQPEIKLIDLDESGNQPIRDLDKYLRYGDYRGCYIAPETVKGQWNIKNDEWAVGITMYFMLKGDVPFFGYDMKETMQLITAYNFDRSSEYWNAISEEGRDLIQRLMAYKPDDRISA